MEARPRREDRIMAALGWLTVVLLVAVPLAVTPGLIDRYRVIKESLSRAHGILAGLGLVVALAFAGTTRFREMLRERAVVAVAGCGVLWAIVTTVVSTHRAYSMESLITFLTGVLVFASAWYAAPRIPLLALDLLVPVVLLNTLLVTLQEYGIYQPFHSDPGVGPHVRSTALLGNPNIVGSSMVLMAVIFAAAAVRSGGARRAWQAFGALTAAAGVLVSQTRTAMIALVAGVILLAIGRSVKRAVIVVAAAAALLGIATALRMPAITKLLALPQAIAARGVVYATSGRVLSALVALEMIRDHPVTGLGLGTFKAQYMPYAVPVIDGRQLPPGIVSVNFGEAHNDHLQLIAETGFPGYLLFLALVVVLVSRIRATPGRDPREQVARGLIVPLAGTLLVLCLAQFPLYVPITRHLLVTMAGLLMGWSRTST
jgi:O-antigen ligase